MPKDYINFMLTGAMATDYSEASCYFLMDSETRSWSSQACETFGLRVDQLPELKLSSDIIGQVTQRAADLTGLPAGIPVVAGTSDMAASLLGSGVYEPGMASDSTGTSTLMTVVSPRPLHHPLVNNLHLANAAWGGFTILDAGGDAVRWARLALADNQGRGCKARFTESREEERYRGVDAICGVDSLNRRFNIIYIMRTHVVVANLRCPSLTK